MTKRKSARLPTMYDVAKRAGVSQTTVSFVINGVPNANIPEETKERIWAAVAELGYRPNAMAQGLRMQRSGIFGFITDEIAITPYAGRIFEGAQDLAWENGKILLLVNTKRDRDIERIAIERLLEHRVEAIIFATMYHRSVNPPSALGEVPAVLLDCFSEDGSFPSVIPDEAGGGRKATEIILQRGHKRIGFLNDTEPIPATLGRLEGYKAALSAHGIAFDEALVYSDIPDAGGGYRGALKLMRLQEPPTALFCFNDRMAMGAYDALRKLGLTIPDDVAVMGFDNQEIIAAHLYPPLSTMQLPHYEMGQWAMRYLLEHGGDAAGLPLVHETIECTFVERSSV